MAKYNKFALYYGSINKNLEDFIMEISLRNVAKKAFTVLVVGSVCLLSGNAALAADEVVDIDLNEYELVEIQPYSDTTEIEAIFTDNDGNIIPMEVEQKLYKSKLATYDENGEVVEKYALEATAKGTIKAEPGESNSTGGGGVTAKGILYYEKLNIISKKIVRVAGEWTFNDYSCQVRDGHVEWRSGPAQYSGSFDVPGLSFDEDVYVITGTSETLRLDTTANIHRKTDGMKYGEAILKIRV